MNILGCDPGVKKSAICVRHHDGMITTDHAPNAEITRLIQNCADLYPGAILVIEKPVAQGPRTARNSTLELVRVADRISQAALRAGLVVYEVPVQVIREQAGIRRNSKGQDEAVDSYLYLELKPKLRLLKEEMEILFKRGGIASNGDKRDAIMASLFNWQDARNAQFKVEL